jgi:hypothetical protein
VNGERETLTLPLADEVKNFAGGGMATGGLLGEDGDAVHRDLEHAPRGFHETDLGIGKGLLQLGGQTGRPGLVVSNDAVLDGDAHGAPAEE